MVERSSTGKTAARQRRARIASTRHRRSPAPVKRSSGRSQIRWTDAITRSEWAAYRAAIHAMRKANIPFLLGGGFALATFTGRWRDTKDIDLYVRPQAGPAAVKALSDAGFTDYYSRLPYDRKWIYRSVRGDVIVDVIWAMANQRARVDDLWFERAGQVSIRDEKLAVVPIEEFLWCKLYILQRDHCDWTDLFNLLYSSSRRIEWEHLMARLQHDLPLLRGALSVFAWLCPGRAQELPGWLWRQLGMPAPDGARVALPKLRRDRIRFLDSRAWFAALQPNNHRLEV